MQIEGTYLDPKVNHKNTDYKREQKRKAKLGFKKTIILDKDGVPVGLEKGTHRVMSKKFADNHQKMS